MVVRTCNPSARVEQRQSLEWSHFPVSLAKMETLGSVGDNVSNCKVEGGTETPEASLNLHMFSHDIHTHT